MQYTLTFHLTRTFPSISLVTRLTNTHRTEAFDLFTRGIRVTSNSCACAVRYSDKIQLLNKVQKLKLYHGIEGFGGRILGWATRKKKKEKKTFEEGGGRIYPKN